MYQFLASLPLEGWVTLLGLVGAALVKPVELASRWFRASGAYSAKVAEIDAQRDDKLIAQLLGERREHEALKEVLRKALDKSLVRENSIVTAAEMLLAIVELVEDPTPAMKLMRLRAIEILELAKRINGNGGAK